jgi:hypothetical protein
MSQYILPCLPSIFVQFYQFNHIEASQLNSTLLLIQINSNNLQNQFTLLPNINYKFQIKLFTTYLIQLFISKQKLHLPIC